MSHFPAGRILCNVLMKRQSRKDQSASSFGADALVFCLLQFLISSYRNEFFYRKRFSKEKIYSREIVFFQGKFFPEKWFLQDKVLYRKKFFIGKKTRRKDNTREKKNETKYGTPKAPESRASEAKTCLREEEKRK